MPFTATPMDGELTDRQRFALNALLAGATQRQAAQTAGVSDRTLRAWQRDPRFELALRRARGQLWAGIAAELIAGAREASAFLDTVLQDESAPALARVAAARVGLDRALGSAEAEDLAGRDRAVLDGFRRLAEQSRQPLVSAAALPDPPPGVELPSLHPVGPAADNPAAARMERGPGGEETRQDPAETGSAGDQPGTDPDPRTPAPGPELEPAQMRAIAALLQGARMPEAAANAGVSDRLLRDWLHDLNFQAALREARCAVWGEQVSFLHALAARAAGVLRDVLRDAGSPLPARLAAARALLAYGPRASRLEAAAAALTYREAALWDRQ